MTSENSNNRQPKSTRTCLDEIIQELVEAKTGFKREGEFLIAIKDALNLRGLPMDTASVEEIASQVSDRCSPVDPRANIVHGGQDFTCKEVQDVMPGFFKENLLHLVNAEQGAGRSTLMLGLFRALLSEQQPASFLNLEVQASKNWRLFLIAPDMPRESWFVPLENYGLITGIAKGGDGKKSGRLIPEVTIGCSDVPWSLSPEDVQEYRELAIASVARGERPLFVFDSYSTLVANYKDMNEIDSQFAQPLQNLQMAMAGTGATTIVLHHTAKSRSGSTASSGSGTNRLGRIPDVVIELEATTRNSKRLFMTSSKRVTPTSLIIEQDFENGEWISHGDAKQAMEVRELLQKIDTLKGPKLQIYEWSQQRWEEQGKGFTTEDVKRLIERSVQTARNHVRVMEANGVIFHCDDEPTVTVPRPVYLPTEYREEWKTRTRKVTNDRETPSKSTKTLAAEEQEREEAQERERAGRYIIPCHPIGTQVKCEGKVWTVETANLATGMHMITRGVGLNKSDLRMLDLPLHYSEDEEL